MSTPSAFDIGRATGTNFGESFRRSRDEGAIENILSNAMQSGDPAVLQQSIGQILSQVSPERQGPAIQYLQNSMQQIQQKQQQEAQRKAALQAGITPDLPPTVQAAQYKEQAKTKRLAEADKAFQNVSPGAQQGKPDKAVLVQLSGHPDMEVREKAKSMLKDIQKEEEQNRADLREIRKETLPIKQKIAEDAQNAVQSIQNKERQLELVESGELNDPTFATVMDMLPGKLGRRFLSNKTVEYKASLVDEFRDLRSIFTGATRVKEIEILENKIADTYYTDEQKKAIIKARMESLETPIIKAEVASEIDQDMPNLGILDFNKELNKRVKARLETNANKVIDLLKNAQNEAEVIKSRPLDVANPQDAEIMKQILQEANGNVAEAYKIAAKKGYKVKK